MQTIKDILRLFTPELLDRINQEVVRAGHQALKKSPEQGLNARPDSFLVETGVEYPTDTGLLYEAVRKALGVGVELADTHGLAAVRPPPADAEEGPPPPAEVEALHRRDEKKLRKKSSRRTGTTLSGPQLSSVACMTLAGNSLTCPPCRYG